MKNQKKNNRLSADVILPQILFGCIGKMTKESLEKGDAAGVTSGQVQRRAKSELNIGYTYFFEYMKKLEELRLVDLVRKDGVHGRMSYVEVRGCDEK